ncbi:hypothetical protein CALCODRAFT_135030 [Calocera cornea HHB12733]|uniref:Uncharacterized protein n=1 Tax=Calocera cornea HHB12733 TaxID=1353952 RepID=A0A165CUX1_9BASI|nr:hypothetical protein CALCODRAFT_135030 [Calocera cornea HHB12733]
MSWLYDHILQGYEALVHLYLGYAVYYIQQRKFRRLFFDWVRLTSKIILAMSHRRAMQARYLRAGLRHHRSIRLF